jgi:hypothetical protein
LARAVAPIFFRVKLMPWAKCCLEWYEVVVVAVSVAVSCWLVDMFEFLRRKKID